MRGSKSYPAISLDRSPTISSCLNSSRGQTPLFLSTGKRRCEARQMSDTAITTGLARVIGAVLAMKHSGRHYLDGAHTAISSSNPSTPPPTRAARRRKPH